MRATVHRALNAQKAALSHAYAIAETVRPTTANERHESRAERPSIAFVDDVDEAQVQPDGEAARARSPQVRSSGPSMARVQRQARNPRSRSKS